MVASATAQTGRRRVRRETVLRAATWGMAFLTLMVMGGIPGLFAPWFFLGDWPGHEFPEMHRWHDAQWGAMMAILLGGSLVLLARRPLDRPVLIQFLVVAGAALVTLNAPFDPLILAGLAFGVLAPLVAIAAVYPRRHALLRFRPPAGIPVNWWLVVVSIVTGAVLARPAWRWYDVQRLRLPEEHSEFQHWTITAVLAVVLVAAGLLAATNRPGSRAVGILAGIALIYLGLAALQVPDHTGSWGVHGGLLAILAGLGYIGGAFLRNPVRIARRLAAAKS